MHKAAGLADSFSGIDLVKLNSTVTGRGLNVSGQSHEPQTFRASAFAGYAGLHWALCAAVCFGCYCIWVLRLAAKQLQILLR